MKFKCPYCGNKLDFMELDHEGDIVAIIKMQPVFGNHAHLVWAYAELFGITPMRAKSKKLRSILTEMARLFQSGRYTYQKKTCEISQAGIAEALDVTVKRNFTTALDSHNYLKKIMLGISEREEAERGRRGEAVLREKEDRLRRGDRPEGISEEDRVENMRRVGELIKGM